LLWNLPKLKVFIDTRETMYDKDLQALPTDEALKQYHVNTAWLPLSGIVDSKEQDKLSHFFPSDEWALVYFDNRAAVLVRKASVSPEFLKSWGYQSLWPTVFPTVPADRESATVQEERQELARCLKQHPAVYICVATDLALAAATKDSSELPIAIERLHTIAASDRRARLLFEDFAEAYRSKGATEIADPFDRALGH
jgi:hypothetical protein